MLGNLTSLFTNSFSGLSRDIWMLSLVTLVNRSGTMVVVFLTIYLTKELHFTLTQAGIVMSFFGLGSLLGSYIGGWLTDRIGYYPTMFWTLFLSGFGFLSLMYVETFYSFCVAILLISTIADSFRPANMASISAYSTPENQNRSLSLIRMAINLGFSIGAGAAGIISMKFGYEWLFIIDGVTCILASFFFLIVMEAKEEKLSKDEEEKVVNGKGASAYKDTNFIIFASMVLINAIVFMQLFSSIPIYYKQELMLSEEIIGYIMVLNGIMIVILEMPMIYLLEKKFKRMPLIIFGAALIGFSYLILNMIDNWMVVVLISITAVSIGEIINFPFSSAFALSRSTPGRRGQFMGLYSMSFSLGFIIAPGGLWFAEHYGFSNLWYLVSVLSVFAVFGYAYAGRRFKVEEELKEVAVNAKY